MHFERELAKGAICLDRNVNDERVTVQAVREAFEEDDARLGADERETYRGVALLPPLQVAVEVL